MPRRKEPEPERPNPFEPVFSHKRHQAQKEPIQRERVIRFSGVRWLLHVLLRYTTAAVWEERKKLVHDYVLPPDLLEQARRQRDLRLTYRRAYEQAWEVAQWDTKNLHPLRAARQEEHESLCYLIGSVVQAEERILQMLYGEKMTWEAFEALQTPPYRLHGNPMKFFGLHLYAAPNRDQWRSLPIDAQLTNDVFLEYGGGEDIEEQTSVQEFRAEAAASNRRDPFNEWAPPRFPLMQRYPGQHEQPARTAWRLPLSQSALHRATGPGALRQPSTSWENQWRRGGHAMTYRALLRHSQREWRRHNTIKRRLQAIWDKEKGQAAGGSSK